MEIKRNILGNRVTFVVSEKLRAVELWHSWNHPGDKEAGRILIIRRAGGTFATVVFFEERRGRRKEERVLRAVNRNLPDCEIYVNGQNTAEGPFDVPDETTIVIEEDYPRIILRFRTPKGGV